MFKKKRDLPITRYFPFCFTNHEENAMDRCKYVYEGPIVIFDKCICDHWHGETLAVSESKAKSNLIYQCKKQCNLVPGTKVTLPGKIKMVH